MKTGMSFRTKLALVVVPPLFVIIGLAVAVVLPQVRTAQGTNDDQDRVRVAVVSMQLTDEVEVEQGLELLALPGVVQDLVGLVEAGEHRRRALAQVPELLVRQRVGVKAPAEPVPRRLHWLPKSELNPAEARSRDSTPGPGPRPASRHRAPTHRRAWTTRCWRCLRSAASTA
mgnify:CR=1 FL=1